MDSQYLTDEQLLRQFAANGDRHALGELAQRHELALLGLCCGILGGRRELALDVVQETWMRVIRFAKSFNNRSSVKTWLYRIAINQCKNMKPSRVQNGPGTSSGHESIEFSEPEPGTVLEGSEDRLALHNALDQLGINKKSVLLLCYHAGMTHEMAAQILGIPLGTLKSRLNAALKELRAALSSEATT